MSESLEERFIYYCSHGQLDELEKIIHLIPDIDCVEINGHKTNPLFASLCETPRHYNVAEFLLEYGADVNVNLSFLDTTILISAIISSAEMYYDGYFNNLEIEKIEFLILHGADVNKTDSKKKTPLDWAIKMKHYEAEKLLRQWRAKTSDELYKK